MMFRQQVRHGAATFALVAAAVLAACGGGSDAPAGVQVPQTVRTGTASASSDLSAANYANFGGPLARSVMSAGDGNVPGVAAGHEAPQARVTRAAVQGSRWVRLALRGVTPREHALAVTTDVVPCDFGGSITVTLNDADNNAKLSSGDSATLVMNNCVVDANLPAANGTLAFSVNAIELDAQDDPTALDVSMTFTGFAEDGFGSLSGSLRVWIKDETPDTTRLRVSYAATAVTEQGTPLAYNFDIYSVAGLTGGTFDLNGALLVNGESYVMRSTTFTYSTGQFPATGSVTLVDAAGDAVTLRARSTTTFDLEYTPNAATAPTMVNSGQRWDAQRLGPV